MAGVRRVVDHTPWLQDEWDVELADGTLCRLAHDGSAWHIAGIYD